MRPLRKHDQPDHLLDVLRSGMAPAEDETGQPIPRPAESDLRDAWDQHGADLVAEFIDRHPGRRPWGFWRFDRGAALLASLRRSWPLTVIGRRGGVRIRNRNEISGFEQRRILADSGMLDETEV